MNRLIHESSPYLLQHAQNPVDWYPYGEEALREAETSRRPLLISIGYSACHWCHVMEHESFSKPEIAEIMNRSFVCVKVDREERPDLDHLYMGAVQLLHNSGGWPLNCFALPDGRPFWGGTYFRPDQWVSLLDQISDLFRNSRHELEEQAERLNRGVGEMSLIEVPADRQTISAAMVDESYAKLSWSFDAELGGLLGSPKFPMPVVWQFVMQYHKMTGNPESLTQLKTTLLRMVCGGLFDRIGGGFARYSTDAEWKVPHFEKMLYDNAQLTGLYANMFRHTGERFYIDVAEQTIEFVLQGLTSPEGLFFSAYDADSEGEEGSFYLWTRDQVSEILPEYGDLLSDYWGIGGSGLWEKGKSILMRPADEAYFASQQHLSEEELKQLLRMAGKLMLAARNKRIPPSLDDKAVLSWNALMIKALAEAFKASGNQSWLDAALKAAGFILKEFSNGLGGAYKRVWKNGKARIPAMLDDYAYLADAWISLYQVTFDENWLFRAKEIAVFVVENFSDQTGNFFWYSPLPGQSGETSPAVARIIGTTDGVEPSGNAVMARILLTLGHYFENAQYIDRAVNMVSNLRDRIVSYPAAYAGWAGVALEVAYGKTTLVITGPDAFRNAAMLNRKFLPGVLVAAATMESRLPVFSEKFVPGKNLIYRCKGNTCSSPVGSVVDLIL